jgi:5-carboxymethyl-2-hydroxymuconate isomerase
MPHIVVEYTDNLGPQADIGGLLKKLAAKMRASDGVFPIGGIRVRAIRLSEYVVADGEEDYAFVHVTVKIGAGRPAEFKKRFFGEMFDLIKTHFEKIYAERYLALSLYIEEVDEDTSYKHNNIHRKFKAKAAG